VNRVTVAIITAESLASSVVIRMNVTTHESNRAQLTKLIPASMAALGISALSLKNN